MGSPARPALAALLLFVLAACGGGGDVPAPEASAKPEAWTASEASHRVVVRFDRDGDGHLDVLTLDTTTNPLRIVEALRGTPEGGAELVTTAWRGELLDDALNRAIQQHLTRSLAVGTATDLDVLRDGTSVTVTVIE